MIKKIKVLKIDLEKFVTIANGIGIIRIISISNTKKITASRKNRRENGIRAEDLGSKPHSNGVDFSRSKLFFVDSINIAVVTITGNIKAVNVIIKDIIISLE